MSSSQGLKKLRKKIREINIELGEKKSFLYTWARHFVSRNSSYNCFRCLCKVANLVLSPCTSNPPDVSFGSFGLILGEGQDSTIIIDSSNGSSIFGREKKKIGIDIFLKDRIFCPPKTRYVLYFFRNMIIMLDGMS